MSPSHPIVYFIYKNKVEKWKQHWTFSFPLEGYHALSKTIQIFKMWTKANGFPQPQVRKDSVGIRLGTPSYATMSPKQMVPRSNKHLVRPVLLWNRRLSLSSFRRWHDVVSKSEWASEREKGKEPENMPPFPSCRTASSCTSRARRDTINTVPAPWGASQPGAWLLLSHWHYTITQLEPELRRGSSSGHLCQALNTCFYSLLCLCENTGIKKNRNIMHIHHGERAESANVLWQGELDGSQAPLCVCPRPLEKIVWWCSTAPQAVSVKTFIQVVWNRCLLVN